MPRRHLLRVAGVALCTALGLGASTLPSSAAQAAGTECRVEDVTASTHHNALHAAVDASTAGDGLLLTGMCVATNIQTNLTIRGLRSASTGVATLDGDGIARVVRFGVGVVVTMKRLTIRNGFADGGMFPVPTVEASATMAA